MKSKRSRTYLVSGLTLALIFVAIILVFRDVLPDIVKDLSTVPFWGVLLLLALGFAYEAMESVLCLVIISPVSMFFLVISFLHRIMPPRGPRRVLWVVVVTTSA